MHSAMPQGVEKPTPLCPAVGMENGTVAAGNNVEIPPKIKTELSYNPAIPLVATYPQNPE